MAKVLIIEDEKSIQRMIEYDLNQLGYDVDCALDGLKGSTELTQLEVETPVEVV